MNDYNSREITLYSHLEESLNSFHQLLPILKVAAVVVVAVVIVAIVVAPGVGIAEFVVFVDIDGLFVVVDDYVVVVVVD